MVRRGTYDRTIQSTSHFTNLKVVLTTSKWDTHFVGVTCFCALGIYIVRLRQMQTTNEGEIETRRSKRWCTRISFCKISLRNPFVSFGSANIENFSRCWPKIFLEISRIAKNDFLWFVWWMFQSSNSQLHWFQGIWIQSGEGCIPGRLACNPHLPAAPSGCVKDRTFLKGYFRYFWGGLIIREKRRVFQRERERVRRKRIQVREMVNRYMKN